MFIKLRKQLNQHQTGGDSLDSPNGGNLNVEVPREIETHSPEIVPGDPKLEIELENKEVLADPANPPKVENEEVPLLHEVAQLAGLDIEGLDIGDAPEDIVKLIQLGEQRGEQNAVKREWEELQAKAAAGVELTKWQLNNPGRNEMEFYAAKMGTPTIDPETIDKDNTVLHKDILTKDFMNKGLSATLAATMAQNLIDSNASYDATKEILKSNADKSAADRAAEEEKRQLQATQRYNDFVADVQARERVIKESGRLGNVSIPLPERESFADANFYDAGDPKYPGMSAIDIKLASMTSEQKDMYRYLVFKDLDISKLVIAKDTTRSVSQAINRGGVTGSKMAGSANTRGGAGDDRSLDSPGKN